MSKIKIAFIKFGGLSAGGTERWLQMMAANLPKDLFYIDYYYCDSAPYVGSDYKHADTDLNRLKYMQDHKVNLIKFNVGYKDITRPTHDWLDTDFWDVFDPKKYDLIQTAKAGPAEYPYYLIKLPVVEYLTLNAGVDYSKNIAWSIHLSKWQRIQWIKNGGKLFKSSVIPIPAEEPKTKENYRKELNISDDAIVAGYHQRNDDNIFSLIPLQAFSKIEKSGRCFIIMGGGNRYKKQAKNLNLKNVHFLEHSAEAFKISKFLNTLDIFAHGRYDGETFGTVFAEAMMHGKPCLSHKSPIANAQLETMGPAGLFASNLEEYTEKLNRLFSDPDLRNQLAIRAKPYAEEHYSLKSCVEKLQKVYFGVLGKEKEKHGNFQLGLIRYVFFYHSNKAIRRIINMFRKIKKAILNPIETIKYLLVFLIKYICGLFQGNKASYEKHNSQYIDKDALNKHIKIFQKYEQENLFNHPENKFADLIAKHPNIRKTAIDIGCGAGWLSARLSREFESVIAIEPSKAAVGMAKQIFAQSKYPNIKWIVGFAEEELNKLKLGEPSFFITGCVLSHLPDKLVVKICKAINDAAHVGSILAFGECWGKTYHEFMWHVRSEEWWKENFPGWEIDFYGPSIEGLNERHKGFHAVKIK